MAQAVTSATRDLDLKHLWHGNLQHQGLEARPPLEVASTEGCYVFDADGRRYLDGMAGLFCVNVGYGRREIVDAVATQMTQLAYYPLTQSHGPAARLAARLAGLLPRGIDRVFFSNSGSEAVETALKMARQCARRLHPGENRYKVIARHRGYHGFTMGALSATGQSPRRAAFEPLVPGFLHVAPPDHYRCGFCSSQPGCTLGCADEIERVIRMEGPETVAAVIAEPVIGGGGSFPPPDGSRERLWENAGTVGAYLIGKLREIRSPFIGEIRGRGLLMGIELVTDADKTPLPEARMAQLQREMREAGVLVGRNNDSVPGYCNVLSLSPPLTLSKEQADVIAEAIAEGLGRW